MSKVITNIKTNKIAPFSSIQYATRNTYTSSSSISVPSWANYCTVKMWGQGGAGGNDSTYGSVGGAAAGVYVTFKILSTDNTIYIYMNSTAGSNTSAPAGGLAGTANYIGGNGGSATLLTRYNTTNSIHTLCAIAGGGGGGGGSSGGSSSGYGGVGGSSGGSGGSAGAGGSGGSNGNGGTGIPNGNNFPTTYPITSSNTPPTWSPNGNGGNTANYTSIGPGGSGGGGGGGFGGGGGGQSGYPSGGGGGGASYIAPNTSAYVTYTGSGQTPVGASGDTDFINTYGKGGNKATAGGNGYAVVYFHTAMVNTTTWDIETNFAFNIFVPRNYLSSSSSITYANTATLYIDGPPIAGTNTTISAPYSLYVNKGYTYFNNGITEMNAARIVGTGTYTSGEGMEMSYNNSTGSIRGYNSSGSYTKLYLNSTLWIGGNAGGIGTRYIGINTISPAYTMDVNGIIQSTQYRTNAPPSSVSTIVPSGTVGVEVLFDSDTKNGHVLTYDRVNGGYKNMYINDTVYISYVDSSTSLFRFPNVSSTIFKTLTCSTSISNITIQSGFNFALLCIIPKLSYNPSFVIANVNINNISTSNIVTIAVRNVTTDAFFSYITFNSYSSYSVAINVPVTFIAYRT